MLCSCWLVNLKATPPTGGGRKIPPVLGSPSANDPKEVAAEVTVAATAAEATEASAPGAVVADVAPAGGVVDGAAPKVAAPMVAAGGRYSGAV